MIINGGMNKEIGGFFFITKYQMIKVEGVLELENHHFAAIMIKVGLGKNHTKSRWGKYEEEQDICITAECLLTDY